MSCSSRKASCSSCCSGQVNRNEPPTLDTSTAWRYEQHARAMFSACVRRVLARVWPAGVCVAPPPPVIRTPTHTSLLILSAPSHFNNVDGVLGARWWHVSSSSCFRPSLKIQSLVPSLEARRAPGPFCPQRCTYKRAH